mmetsp:Transcript_60630/g.166055  ORF Transcript_60630/g.166055 Transcript_60630/m.166055 type:complete len:109 (-) Transcript_60630:642-968(-)
MSSSASAPGPGLFNVSSTPGGAARSARASGSSGGSTTTPETAPHLVIGAYPWAEACALRKPAPGFEIALYALALLTLPATRARSLFGWCRPFGSLRERRHRGANEFHR